MLLASTGVPSVSAQNPDRDPWELVLTNEEAAGKASLLMAEEECSDERARCVHKRWERDIETDAALGPGITDTHVWVARDVERAKAIYRDQEKLQRTMPEGVESANGPFKWEAPRPPVAEEWTGANACERDRCEQPGVINLHQRVVARTDNVVSVVYLWGRSRNSTPELAVYYTTRIMQRVNPPAEPAE